MLVMGVLPMGRWRLRGRMKSVYSWEFKIRVLEMNRFD